MVTDGFRINAEDGFYRHRISRKYLDRGYPYTSLSDRLTLLVLLSFPSPFVFPSNIQLLALYVVPISGGHMRDSETDE